MPTSNLLMLLAGLLVLAFVAEEGFRWLRIPPLLILMGCGLLLGPVAHVLFRSGDAHGRDRCARRWLCACTQQPSVL